MDKRQEMMLGGGIMPGMQAKSKDVAVIARLPVHVKSMLMLLAISNSAIFIMFGLDWLGMSGDMSQTMIAISAMAAFWCVLCIPIFMWFITRTDWGQRSGG